MSETERPVPIEELLAHRRWLVALARGLVGAGGAADDLVQETWVAALTHPPTDRRGLRGWLATVLRNLARQGVRRAAVRDRAAGELARSAAPGAGPTAELVAGVERERALARAVLGLEEPYRTAVLLRYYRGLSSAAIARSLGLPAATVRGRVKRGLERLRERLDTDHGGAGRAFVLSLLPRTGSHGWTGAMLMSAKTKIVIAAAAVLLAGGGTWLLLGRTPTPRSARDAGAAPLAPAKFPGSPAGPAGGKAASGAAGTAPAAGRAAPAGAAKEEEGAEERREREGEQTEGAEANGPASPFAANLERKVDVRFDDLALVEAVRILADRAGLRMHIDPAVSERSPDELRVDLHAAGVTVRNALSLLTVVKGLRWEVTGDGVIEIRGR
jgi:RNA polymerase sigma-70 factor (ECF subfamily)